jgi:CubicO group peptidase (beta-lactamase class C family)
MRTVRLTATGLVAFCVAIAAPSAQAAKRCTEPRGAWQRATPAEEGMDAAKLQSALDYGTTQLSFALRVYRRGCLVAEDRAAPVNRDRRYESYSMAKSVTSLAFGRAMRLGVISPDDPVGSLVPEADRAHGGITMWQLLTQSSGLEWNGFRDYNVFTMPDRVHDALTLRPVHRPGTYFEYAQSPVALLAEAIGRAAGEDVQAFAQRELMDPIGIPADAWTWGRDPAGHVQGFYGVGMRPDDYGRLGELLRRGGVWRNRRLLSGHYMRQAIAPSRTNGCYGWLIWVNAGKPCIGPRVGDRPVEHHRDFPDLPANMYSFDGLFGQRVTIFPSQAIVLVRTGQDPNLVYSPGRGWEDELYRRVLGAVTDQRIGVPGDAPPSSGADERESDYGFQDALLHPDRYRQGVDQDPLPPAGPRRARAALLGLARRRVSRRGEAVVRLWCPAQWPGQPAAICRGRARVTGGHSRGYRVAPGRNRLLRLRLTRRRLRKLRRRRTLALVVSARNQDATGGTPTRLAVTVRRAARRR